MKPTRAPRASGPQLDGPEREVRDPNAGLFLSLAERSCDVVYRYRVLPTPAFDYLSPSVEALTGYDVEAFAADPGLFEELVHPDDRQLLSEANNEDGATVRWIRRDGTEVWVEHRNVLIRGAGGQVVAAEGMARDVTDQVAATAALKESEQRFRALLDVVGVAAVILDTVGCVTFVNQHFLSATGWARDQVEGADWFDVFVPAEERDSRRELFGHSLHRGLGSLSETTHVMASDGSRRQFAMSTTVLHDAAGRATGVAGIGADLTELHSVERERDRLGEDLREAEALARSAARQRAEIVGALQRMGPLATFEETAQAMCDEMIKLTHIDFTSIDTFEGQERLCVIGASGSRVLPGEYIPQRRAAYLWERASRGAWTEVWADRGDSFGRRVARAGEQAVAISPIVTERGLVGVLVLGTKSATFAPHLVEVLPAAVEFAAIARSLLGTGLEARHDEVSLRAQIEQVIQSAAFHPVFQPVVDLETLQPVGYEALTRFSSRQRPDHVFAAARRTGLGLDLEFATLAAALKEAAELPEGTWLSLNVSPACVLAGAKLRRILTGRTRPIVLEITEHENVGDYAALREAIVKLGPDVRVAVDDAGAGVANFRHLVELRPDFVKIDGALVKNVNADVTRQALVVGLGHFARTTGHFVIAEGVETQAELATLRGLDVRYGQGYLLGRPMPINQLQVTRRRPARRKGPASTNPRLLTAV